MTITYSDPSDLNKQYSSGFFFMMAVISLIIILTVVGSILPKSES